MDRLLGEAGRSLLSERLYENCWETSHVHVLEALALTVTQNMELDVTKSLRAGLEWSRIVGYVWLLGLGDKAREARR